MKRYFGPRFRALHWCTEQTITNDLAKMDLTASQGQILGYIARAKEPPCARDIEEFFQISHPTVSGTLSRLEKKGFIVFRADPTDRRCKRICILPKGEECHAAIAKTLWDMEEKIVADFTPEEQAQFSHLLDRAIHNMGGGMCCHKKKEENIQ